MNHLFSIFKKDNSALYLDYLPDELINILFNCLKSYSKNLCDVGDRYSKLYNERIDNIKNGNIEPDDAFLICNNTDFSNKFKGNSYDNSVMMRDLVDRFKDASSNLFVGNINYHEFYINDEIVEYKNWKDFINGCGLNKILYFYLTPSWVTLDCVRFLIYKDINRNYVYIREQKFYDSIKIHIYINKRWKVIYYKLKFMEKYIFLNQQGYSEYKLISDTDKLNCGAHTTEKCNIYSTVLIKITIVFMSIILFIITFM